MDAQGTCAVGATTLQLLVDLWAQHIEIDRQRDSAPQQRFDDLFRKLHEEPKANYLQVLACVESKTATRPVSDSVSHMEVVEARMLLLPKVREQFNRDHPLDLQDGETLSYAATPYEDAVQFVLVHISLDRTVDECEVRDLVAKTRLGLIDESTELSAELARLDRDLDFANKLAHHVVIRTPQAAEVNPGKADPRTTKPDAVKANVMMSARDIATYLFGTPTEQIVESISARLARWRKSNPGNSGWREVLNPSPREPKYVYQLCAAERLFKSPVERRSK